MYQIVKFRTTKIIRLHQAFSTDNNRWPSTVNNMDLAILGRDKLIYQEM